MQVVPDEISRFVPTPIKSIYKADQDTKIINPLYIEKSIFENFRHEKNACLKKNTVLTRKFWVKTENKRFINDFNVVVIEEKIKCV